MTANRDKLLNYLNKLRHASLASAILINTKGIRIHLLKERYGIYCLIVPNSPLMDYDHYRLVEAGFREKFKRINYDKEFDMSNDQIIIDKVLYAINDVLGVPNDREWIFDINPGMGIIKNHEPEKPNSLRREKQIKSNKAFLKRFLRFLLSDFGFGLLFGLLIFYLLYKGESKTFELSMISGVLAFLIIISIFKLQKHFKKK